MKLNSQGVNLSAIPLLRSGFTLRSIDELSIGGRAPKDLVEFRDSRPLGHAYIAKQPTKSHTGARECVIEHLLSEIGRSLPLKVARSRLVRLPTTDGLNNDIRFMSRYFLRHGVEQLTAGVELVARALDAETQELEQQAGRGDAERKFYSIDLIEQSIETLWPDPRLHIAVLQGLYRLLAHDALLGAGDRHAENWAIIENLQHPETVRFAPVYDTARGLFLRYDEEKVSALSAQARHLRLTAIKEYADRSQPLIGVPGEENCNHFELFRYLVNGPNRNLSRSPACRVVEAFGHQHVALRVRSKFSKLLSSARLQLILELLEHRASRLREIIRDG